MQTVDFFAPIVDDPFDFGQIAAANALSDVYAMGGEPLTALNIVAFPDKKFPSSLLTEILRGGQEKVHEAGAVIVGGHTVTDDELKYGLAVTGWAHPDRLLTNAGAHLGDVLVVTKAIGTGAIATAGKRGDASPDEIANAIRSMKLLNRDASRAALAIGVTCATDVTGFGLLGHASHIARASAVTLVLDAHLIPELPGARAALKRGDKPGGTDRNLSYLHPLVEWGRATDLDRNFLADPQTSGGLLLAVPAGKVADYLSRVPGAAVIGEVEPQGAAAIRVR